MARMERTTMRRIREAIEKGTLVQPFRPSDVNRALGIDYGGSSCPSIVWESGRIHRALCTNRARFVPLEVMRVRA
jgi:hypothetical protein